MTQTVIVNEIFRTILGEGARAGRPGTIVRLTGCNLRCTWCDTQYAYEEGREMSLEAVAAEIERLEAPNATCPPAGKVCRAGGPGGCALVLVTGGEPLLQQAARALLARLCDAGREVLLETNGSLDVSTVDPRVVRCVDVKCPGSGEGGSFLPSNLHCLRGGDEVKFVLADEEDYRFARRMIEVYDLPSRCEVILTPAAGVLSPATLAEWILAEPEPSGNVRLGLQIHKVIWPGVERGV